MKTQSDNSLSLLGKLALIRELVDKAQMEIEQLSCDYGFQSSSDRKEVQYKLKTFTECCNGVYSLTSDAISEASNTYLETRIRK